MRKVLLSALIALIIGTIPGQAQKIPEFKQKMYVDSLNRLYVNKDQPIYLWLSTTQNKDSVVLLQSHESKNYVNPFYFDTEGMNTVRTPSKVDKKTREVVVPKSDIIFEVYADGLAPVSYLHFSEAKEFVKTGKNYYGKGLSLKISARDAVSGVQDIYYSINGSEYKKYQTEIHFEKEGEVILKYFSVDHVGNVEKIKTKTFFLDFSPPVIKKEKTGTTTGNVLSKNTKIVLTATDNLSGVKNVFYSIDGKSPVLYAHPLPAYILGEGEHKFDYYAVDNVGNTSLSDEKASIEYSTPLIYDNSGPEVSIVHQSGCSYEKNNILYLAKNCKIGFDANDDYTAVKKIEYGIDTKTQYVEYIDNFSMPENKKSFALYYRAVDEVNNYSKAYYKQIIIDDKAPVSWIKFGLPHFFDRDTFFISDKTVISLFAKDERTGVLKTEYSINNSSFVDYSKNFKLNKYGFNTIRFKSTDKVGNQEKVKTSNVVMDNLAPEIYVRFSIESIGTKEYDGEQVNIYPRYSKMYIAATDKNSGTASILYSVNNSGFLNYAVNNQITKGNVFSKAGFYTVKIKATDKLGNKKEELFKFFIE
ncbi:MAG: hypothetical protein L3J74_08735 [Bacteroidales bacterium]|nr:hypothetical protein [Bacteroidales bacterium]